MNSGIGDSLGVPKGKKYRNIVPAVDIAILASSDLPNGAEYRLFDI